MKLGVFLLAFVAVTVNVAYTAPQAKSDTQDLQALLKKVLEQSAQDDEGGVQDEDAELQSPQEDEGDIQDFLASMQQDDEGVETQDLQDLLASMQQDDEDAELQEFFAREQIPAHMQGWWKRAWRKVKKVARKVVHYGRKYGPYLSFLG